MSGTVLVGLVATMLAVSVIIWWDRLARAVVRWRIRRALPRMVWQVEQTNRALRELGAAFRDVEAVARRFVDAWQDGPDRYATFDDLSLDGPREREG